MTFCADQATHASRFGQDRIYSIYYGVPKTAVSVVLFDILMSIIIGQSFPRPIKSLRIPTNTTSGKKWKKKQNPAAAAAAGRRHAAAQQTKFPQFFHSKLTDMRHRDMRHESMNLGRSNR